MEVKIELGPLTKLGWMLLMIALWPVNVVTWVYDGCSANPDTLDLFLAISAIVSWIIGGILGTIFTVVWLVHGFNTILFVLSWAILGYGFYAGRTSEW